MAKLKSSGSRALLVALFEAFLITDNLALCARSVVVAELSNKQGILMNFINHSVLIVNPSRPISRKSMFERLRLSNAFEWLSLDFLEKGIDTFKYLLVRFLPVKVIFPCLLCKN